MGKAFNLEQRSLVRLSFDCSLLLLGRNICAQRRSWEADVTAMLSELMACQNVGRPRSPCNVFLGRTLKRLFGIPDFEILRRC
jgi:hypothetical protein